MTNWIVTQSRFAASAGASIMISASHYLTDAI
jgi:hypothetical protein